MVTLGTATAAYCWVLCLGLVGLIRRPVLTRCLILLDGGIELLLRWPTTQ